MEKTTPATMLTAPLETIPWRWAGASEKSKWRNPFASTAPWET